MKNENGAINIPLDVKSEKHQEYLDNYKKITKNTHRLLLFSCDQKIEHLNDDFYGPGIDKEALLPDHLFQIASQGKIGAIATQLGLIARYAHNYPQVNYIIKLNSKTNIIPTEKEDPISNLLWQINDVLELKNNSGLNICGIGYTIYLGSKYENIMLAQAAQAIYHAHQNGLIAIIWIYPRGQHIINPNDAKYITGAAGIANALGADFVKINVQNSQDNPEIFDILKIASKAAGNTKIITAGGKSIDQEDFLKETFDQLTKGEIAGRAIGRNIFQKSLVEAVALTNALSSIIYDLSDLNTAFNKLKT